MKAAKEIKRWVNWVRSWRGRKNGVIPWLWDAPEMGRKHANSKKLYKRSRRVPEA